MGTPAGTQGQDAPGPAPEGGDDDDGPQSCSDLSDCVDACPDGSFGCTCATTPQGDLCVPTCTEDAHCEGLPGPGNLTCDEAEGICVPDGP